MRPSERTVLLPHGPSPESRTAFLRKAAELLLETRAWPSTWDIGDSSHLVLEIDLGGEDRGGFYVQFLSEPGESGVLCEVASGFSAGATGVRPTPAQRDAMVSRGFSDGLQGNFRREFVFDAPDAATAILDETFMVLAAALGFRPGAAVRATVRHRKRSRSETVLDGLGCDDVVELLTRRGALAARSRPGEPPSGGATVEASMGGLAFSLHLANAVAQSSRFRLVAARARVGKAPDAAAANPFNAATGLGRSWVREGDAYLEASFRVADVTEAGFHHWLDAWGLALATATSWYRRIAVGPPGAYRLSPIHFDALFHDAERIARCHLKPAAQADAVEAFVAHLRACAPEERGSVDAWAFFATHAAAHPDVAVPIGARFVSRVQAPELISWLERIDGVRAVVTASGELEVSHAVRSATWVLPPGAVRRLALRPERFALSVEIELDGVAAEVVVGTEDFHFAPSEARVDLGGVAFVLHEMPASVSWFETRLRLRSVEREIAWAGAVPCGGAIAWLHAALAGAERVGLSCGAERSRLDAVLAGAARSWRATADV